MNIERRRWTGASTADRERDRRADRRRRDPGREPTSGIRDTDGASYQYEQGAMSTITTRDGTQIYDKDWGKGQPMVFDLINRL